MIISFVETESADERYFSKALAGHTLYFAATLEDVPRETELLSTFIYSFITADFLTEHPALQFITTRSTRFDHIDATLCRVRGIRVSHVPGYNIAGVAEHTIALMLALARQLPTLLQPPHPYAVFSFERTRAFHLQGKTLGIIGTGRIGRRVIQYARAFEMKVIACDVAPDRLLAFHYGFEYAPLEEVLRQADILSIHTPVTEGTRCLINRETLALCKPGVYIINTSRGILIDTDALLEGLDSGLIAGAGLDVLEQEETFPSEPITQIRDQILEHLSENEERQSCNIQRVDEIQRLMRNSAIIQRENVIFTPHVGFNSWEVSEELNRRTYENIAHFLRGAPINEVDYFAGPER